MTVRALLLVPLLSSCVKDLIPPAAPPVVWLDLALPGTFDAKPPRQGLRPIKLEPIQATPMLGDRLLFREGPHEVRFANDTRWLEAPALAFERALRSELFGARALPSARTEDTLTLRVTLERFELDQSTAEPTARVRATLEARSGATILLYELIEETEAAPSATPLAAAEALRKAARATLTRLAERTEALCLD